MVLVRIPEFGLVEQLVQGYHLLVGQVLRPHILIHSTAHLHNQPSCIVQTATLVKPLEDMERAGAYPETQPLKGIMRRFVTIELSVMYLHFNFGS